jgi:hypothetical protein
MIFSFPGQKYRDYFLFSGINKEKSTAIRKEKTKLASLPIPR